MAFLDKMKKCLKIFFKVIIIKAKALCELYILTLLLKFQPLTSLMLTFEVSKPASNSGFVMINSSTRH